MNDKVGSRIRGSDPVVPSVHSSRRWAEIPLGAHPRNTGGKKGRSRRPPSAIRGLCRLSFEERVAALTHIIDDSKSRDADKIRAMDLLGKYGVGTLKEHEVERFDRMELVLVDEGARPQGGES
jgi:hypothetical protein